MIDTNLIKRKYNINLTQIKNPNTIFKQIELIITINTKSQNIHLQYYTKNRKKK